MSLSPVARVSNPVTFRTPKLTPVIRVLEHTVFDETEPVLFVSTFCAKPEWKPMMRYELGRLTRAARRHRQCISCDLFRSPFDDSVFIIHSLWTSRDVWLAHRGWEGNPVGMGLLDKCLLKPIETTEMTSGPRDKPGHRMLLREAHP